MADEFDNNIPQEDELPEGIIELTDEDGVTTQFEYLTTIDHEGELYVVLMVAQDEEQDDEDGEVLILKIEKDPETDEDIYVSVDDDAISQAVFDKFAEELHIKSGETTEDGLFTLDAIRCMGACALAPAMSVNGKVYPKVTPDQVGKIIDEYRALEAA